MRTSPGLERLRSSIDAIDARLVALLARRARLALKTLTYKRKGRERDAARERAVLRRVRALARAEGLAPALAQRTYRAILAGTVSLQKGNGR